MEKDAKICIAVHRGLVRCASMYARTSTNNKAMLQHDFKKVGLPNQAALHCYRQHEQAVAMVGRHRANPNYQTTLTSRAGLCSASKRID